MQRVLFPLLFTVALANCSAPPWQTRLTDDSAWLLAVSELSGAVITVGGQPGAGPGQPGSGLAQIIADGENGAVDKLPSPQPGMLWWTHTLSAGAANGVAWLCGENGSVLRYAESSGEKTLSPVAAATHATLYGIWAFSDDDVWAVGGDPGAAGVILHGDKSGLVVDTSAPTVPVLFKIFAPDADHLFVVGEGGTLLRRVGTSWLADPSPVTDRLLTAFGTAANDIYAVGGLAAGRLLHFDGTGWSQDPAVADFDALAGLHVTADETLIAGQRGFIGQRGSGATAFTVAESGTMLDLHGALRRGNARYAVGGNLSQFGLEPPRGVLLQQGLP